MADTSYSDDEFQLTLDNIVDGVLLQAGQRPEHPAIADGNQKLTYVTLADRVLRTASHLASLGIERGDTVALLMHDNADHLVLQLAAAVVGAASVSLDWRGRPAERKKVLAAVVVKLVVRDAAIRVAPDESVVNVDDAWHAAVAAAPTATPLKGLRDTPFRILLSSGSTGEVKALALSHLGGCAWARSVTRALRLKSDERHLSPLPLAFTGSLVFNLPQLLLGNTLFLMPPIFTPKEFVGVVERESITGAAVAPTILRRLLPLAEDEAPLLETLRYLVSLGSPLTAEERLLMSRVISPRLYDNYGASGAGPITFLDPTDIHLMPSSVGRAAPLREVEVVDDLGRAVEDDAVGWLRCRGPGVAQSFVNGATEEGSEQFRDGWYYPGDLAHRDQEGFIFIDGRATDLIIRGGLNVYPAEVERVLMACPGVREAAVLGVPSGDEGEKVIAFVAIDGEASKRDLIEACKLKLSSYKVPSDIIFVENLPKNPAGKILKANLRAGLTASDGSRPQ